MARRPPTTSSVSRKCEFINKICHFWCDNKNEKTHKRQSQHQSAEPSSKIPNNQFRKYLLCVFLNNFFFAAEELLMHRIVSSACSAWARGFVYFRAKKMKCPKHRFCFFDSEFAQSIKKLSRCNVSVSFAMLRSEKCLPNRSRHSVPPIIYLLICQQQLYEHDTNTHE